ncbi:MAG: hypothetical protein ACR2FS_15150 [Phormidesmis sp.]
MSKLALNDLDLDLEDVKFENDLDQPLIGAIIKEPTTLGIAYGLGSLGLCFVPGFGWLSAAALLIMGVFDVKATLAADTIAPKSLSLGPASLDTAELLAEHDQMEADQWNRRLASPPRPVYDPDEYSEPSPFGSSKRTPHSTADRMEFMQYRPEQESLLEPAAEAAVELRVQDELRSRGIEPATPSAIELEHECLARQMMTVDDSGYLRSWFIAAITRTGKGAALLAAMLMAADSGLGINFWVIEPKDDPNERYRWSAVPAERRIHFEAAHPGTNAPEVAQAVKALTLRFYDAKQAINILIVDELKVLMDCLGRAGKEHQQQFSSFLSGVASTGASRQRYVWTTTTAIGVAENGLNSKGDRSSFVEAYLVTERSKNTVTSHKSFDLNPSVPAAALGESGRAFITSQDNEWHPVPLRYKALDETLKASQPEPLTAPAPKIAEPTDGECQDLADVLISVVTSQRAIALSLEQIAEHHPGIKQMLNSPDFAPVLDATVRRAGKQGLLRVFEIGDVLSVGAIRRTQQRA